MLSRRVLSRCVLSHKAPREGGVAVAGVRSLALVAGDSSSGSSFVSPLTSTRSASTSTTSFVSSLPSAVPSALPSLSPPQPLSQSSTVTITNNNTNTTTTNNSTNNNSSSSNSHDTSSSNSNAVVSGNENTAVRHESTAAPHVHKKHQHKDVIDYAALSDEQLHQEVVHGRLKFFDIENQLGDMERAVKVRRGVVEQKVSHSLEGLPFQHFDYAAVHGQCAENVIGYVPIPVGVAGPLVVNGKEYHVPLATTEGALVASTTRGCKAISMSGGAQAFVIRDGISRAPVLRVPSAQVAFQLKDFIDNHFKEMEDAFNSTSRFARLTAIKTFVAGHFVYLRFICASGDAMGMNMVSKGCDKALELLTSKFPVQVMALSGNVCTDKKPSAINWMDGRGKSVICEATITGDVVESVLKTTVDAMVQLNYSKNLVGSALAGSIGGFNAHASNIVTATFLATGQDPAQNVESSNCMTLMESANEGKDLFVSVNMPSLEVGTVGGGTILPGQAACLEMLGVKGSNKENPGENSRQLAKIISGAVLAGELSLMAALSAGHLIRSHLKLNRKPSSPSHPPHHH